MQLACNFQLPLQIKAKEAQLATIFTNTVLIFSKKDLPPRCILAKFPEFPGKKLRVALVSQMACNFSKKISQVGIFWEIF